MRSSWKGAPRNPGAGTSTTLRVEGDWICAGGLNAANLALTALACDHTCGERRQLRGYVASAWANGLQWMSVEEFDFEVADCRPVKKSARGHFLLRPRCRSGTLRIKT